MGRLVIETRPPDFQSGVQAPAIRSTQIRAVDENRTRVSLCLGKVKCTSSYTTTALLSRAANQNRTGILCLEDRRTNRCAIAANYKLICGATLSRTRASGFSVQRANNHLHHMPKLMNLYFIVLALPRCFHHHRNSSDSFHKGVKLFK